MRINLTVASPAPIGLPAISVLTHLKDVHFFHAERGLRHPLSAYRVSFNRVIEAMTPLLDGLEQFNALPADTAYDDDRLSKQIRLATENTLKALQEHIDACKGVIRSLFPEDPKEAKAEGRLLRSFREAIKFSEVRFGSQANAIKHRTARVRLLHISYIGGMSTLGYFIEGNVELGRVGPDPDIHKGGKTAFSFNREMRICVMGLYQISEALFLFVRGRHGLIDTPLPEADDHEWRSLLSRVSRLPIWLFPDEYRMSFPHVKLDTNTCILRYQEGDNIAEPSTHNARIRYFHEMDATTPSFTLPYLSE